MSDLARIEDELPEQTLAHLRAAGIEGGRPVIAVDVDDTLVVFVEHLDRWMRGQGMRMHLDSYQLEGSMFRNGDPNPLPFSECIEVINGFFRAEARAQKANEGGREALDALSGAAQIVILTNVPRFATEDRRANLIGLGLDYPLIVNSGGKGRAMAWLAAVSASRVALVDDSTSQLESCAKHVPDSVRVHFAGAGHIHRLFPETAHATHRVRDWEACREALEKGLKLRAVSSERTS